MIAQSSLMLSGNRQLRMDGFSEWIARRAIRLFGLRVGIQTNQPEFLEYLEKYFPPLWQSTSGATVDRIFSLWIGKNRYAVFENNALRLRARSLKRVLEDFERRLKMYVAEMARRRVFVHAGVVGWQGKAIIIPGRSYSGKTTLVRALVEAGAIYYSDEYAVFDLQGRVHPYPQPLAIRKPGQFAQKKCPVEDFGGIIGDQPLPVSLLLVSKYQNHVRWHPIKLTLGNGMLALLDNTVAARRKPEIVLPVLQKAIFSATLLKGDRGEAAEIVEHLLLKKYA